MERAGGAMQAQNAVCDVQQLSSCDVLKDQNVQLHLTVWLFLLTVSIKHKEILLIHLSSVAHTVLEVC